MTDAGKAEGLDTDRRLAALAGDARPALLWSNRAGRLAWKNEAAERLLDLAVRSARGGKGVAAMAPAVEAMLAQAARPLPRPGAGRLEMLRFPGRVLFGPIACICRSLTIEGDDSTVLIMATEVPRPLRVPAGAPALPSFEDPSTSPPAASAVPADDFAGNLPPQPAGVWAWVDGDGSAADPGNVEGWTQSDAAIDRSDEALPTAAPGEPAPDMPATPDAGGDEAAPAGDTERDGEGGAGAVPSAPRLFGDTVPDEADSEVPAEAAADVSTDVPAAGDGEGAVPSAPRLFGDTVPDEVDSEVPAEAAVDVSTDVPAAGDGAGAVPPAPRLFGDTVPDEVDSEVPAEAAVDVSTDVPAAGEHDVPAGELAAAPAPPAAWPFLSAAALDESIRFNFRADAAAVVTELADGPQAWLGRDLAAIAGRSEPLPAAQRVSLAFDYGEPGAEHRRAMRVEALPSFDGERFLAGYRGFAVADPAARVAAVAVPEETPAGDVPAADVREGTAEAGPADEAAEATVVPPADGAHPAFLSGPAFVASEPLEAQQTEAAADGAGDDRSGDMEAASAVPPTPPEVISPEVIPFEETSSAEGDAQHAAGAVLEAEEVGAEEEPARDDAAHMADFGAAAFGEVVPSSDPEPAGEAAAGTEAWRVEEHGDDEAAPLAGLPDAPTAGRDVEPGPVAVADESGERPAGAVIELGERREPRAQADSKIVRLYNKPFPLDRQSLSPSERIAFGEIARALGARVEGEPREPAVAEGKDEPGREEPKPTRLDLDDLAQWQSDQRSEHGADRDVVKAVRAQLAGQAAPEGETGTPGDVPSVLDRLPIGILIARDGQISFANRSILELLGHADIEAIRRAGGLDAIFVGQGLAEAREGENASGVLLRTAEGESVAVDGRLHTVRWDGDNAMLISVRRAVSEDGGERARVAERRADELQAILDTATDGVVILDEIGRIGGINRSAEALFGYEAEELAGRDFLMLFAPESHRAAYDYIESLKANGVASLLNDGREITGRVRQGGYVPMFMTVGRLGGDGRRYCAVLRDMTAVRKAEGQMLAARKQAEDAAAQKADILARIGNELRVPVNAIIGLSQEIASERFGAVGNERYRDHAREIRASGERVIGLIDDVLDLTRIEAGRLDLAFTSVDVNDVVQQAVGAIQLQASRERIIVRMALASNLPNIVADGRSIRQIVQNLLANSLKLTMPGGQVIVSTTLSERGEAVLRVRDTGVGMTEKEMGAALEPFRQPPGEGLEATGLGLPLTKALVEANRATFAIQSAKNSGTLAEVVFPATRVLAE